MATNTCTGGSKNCCTNADGNSYDCSNSTCNDYNSPANVGFSCVKGAIFGTNIGTSYATGLGNSDQSGNNIQSTSASNIFDVPTQGNGNLVYNPNLPNGNTGQPIVPNYSTQPVTGINWKVIAIIVLVVAALGYAANQIFYKK